VLSDGCRRNVFLERHCQFAPDQDFLRFGVDNDVRSLRGGDAGAEGKDDSDWNVVHEEDPVVGQVEQAVQGARALVGVGFGARAHKRLLVDGRSRLRG
jgi:hypothetical protein